MVAGRLKSWASAAGAILVMASGGIIGVVQMVWF